MEIIEVAKPRCGRWDLFFGICACILVWIQLNEARGWLVWLVAPRNVHVQDLDTAVSLATGVYPVEIGPPLAFLFLVHGDLIHEAHWSAFFSGGDPSRFSVYIHQTEAGSALGNWSGKVKPVVVQTVPTGWCELVGAEMALYAAAARGGHEKYVLLSHDALPLVPFSIVEEVLLAPSRRGASSLCFAGIAGLDVSLGCSYASRPWWGQALQAKHHQWTVLSREAVQRVTSPGHAAAARRIFRNDYLAQPLCSDEIFYLLAILSSVRANHFSDLRAPGAALGTDVDFFSALRGLEDVREECFTYAAWPGCEEGEGGFLGALRYACLPPLILLGEWQLDGSHTPSHLLFIILLLGLLVTEA